MKTKEFFSSASFKSIIVLIVIAVALGGVLAILNDVLYVSPEEEVSRALKKLFGREVGWEERALDAEFSENSDFGSINTVYLLEDGNFLLKSTGKSVYKNGSVTLWVVLSLENGRTTAIENVSYASNESQSLMSKFGVGFYEYFSDEYDGGYFDGSHVEAGATYTSKAIANAVNMALFYTENVLEGGTADEG